MNKRHTKVPSYNLQFHDVPFLSVCEMSVNKLCTNEIVGARLFMNVYFRRLRIKALYDTGAAVSVINDHVFRKIQDSGTPLRPITQCEFPRLTTASGSHMQILGVYSFEMTIAGRTFSAPLVVSPDIQNQCIIGMNIIRACGLLFDAQSETLGYKDSPLIPAQCPPIDEISLANFRPTKLTIVNPVTVAPHTARLVTAALVDVELNKCMLLEGEFLADIAGVAVAFRTSKEGTCKLYVPNCTSDDVTLARGDLLGQVSPRDSTEVVTEPEQVAALSQKLVQANENAFKLTPKENIASQAEMRDKISAIVNPKLSPLIMLVIPLCYIIMLMCSVRPNMISGVLTPLFMM